MSLFIAAVFVALAVEVLVLQLGAPLLGSDRPHLGRTLITVVVAAVASVMGSALLSLPLGCLGAVLGGAGVGLLGLVAAMAIRAVLYDFLLGLGIARAAFLSIASSMLGWGLQAAALYLWLSSVIP